MTARHAPGNTSGHRGAREPGAHGRHLSDLPVRPRWLGALLTLTGLLGWAASLVLTVEGARLDRDPAYVPSCSLGAVLSCGSVMSSPEAAVLGFPNAHLGLVGFAVTTVLGVLLLRGAHPPRWVWLGFQAGVTAAAVFVAWLVWVTVYRVGALCLYCTLVWAVVIPLFWATTADTLDRGRIPVPAAWRPVVRTLVDYRTLLVLLSYALVLAVVAAGFPGTWRPLLP